ncbi:MAG TPA: class I SAM-dependent methyltransferase [Amycolatopsis sp.]|uniref:class I SAM-dependent methyltransferase n=1 Tax=Amycolatopsis sp. TaxID=37632 RepID=UPI002B45BC5B|nr:class I SAM-dependent methyltransferase [Amycolatopsis sp.]HKS47662.1 class I SAM-dependent methyltransferase [Amycolatopsis sp.]
MDDYLVVNKAKWDERAPIHAGSVEYGFERFCRDPGHLSNVVRFDLPRLGDVTGLRGVHLQCHIGTDTLSLSRLGAKMTGLDLSPESLVHARRLAEGAGADLDFVEANVYDAVDALGAESFDLVYTGIGALCWLPDVARWARVVSGLLRPGGRLFIREGHPVLWALDERADGLVLRYPYFEHPEPLVFDEPETYVENDAVFEHGLSHTWNHGVGEIITAVLGAGLRLTQFVEHDSVHWNALPGQMEMNSAGEWCLRDQPGRLPATYTLQAVKA